LPLILEESTSEFLVSVGLVGCSAEDGARQHEEIQDEFVTCVGVGAAVGSEQVSQCRSAQCHPELLSNSWDVSKHVRPILVTIWQE
jgi:hypothetical protein